MKNIILLLFFTVTAFAAAPKKFTGDVLQFGGGANGSLKELIINSGGASNPSIQAASGDGSLLLRTDALSVGNGTATDKDFTFDVGLGASNPKLFWDNTAQAISFSNDGTLVKKIGSGSGGGGGENFNNAFLSSQNANAEDGLVQWSNVGTGTFSLDTTDALEGDQSFSFASSAQNDYVEGPLLNMSRDVLKGRACQARIEYVGGDSTLELRLVDASGALFKSLPLKAHTLSAAEDLFFLCPSAADITADANLAQLRLQVYNAGATAAPLIKFDKAYVGTLIGLSETTLPDTCSVTSSSTAVFDSTCGSGITITHTATGIIRLNYGSLNLSSAPVVQALALHDLAVDSNTTISFAGTPNPTYSEIYSSHGDNSVLYDPQLINWTIHKMGADAKQQVQVYKSIPKVSENVNTFTGLIDMGSGSIIDKNIDWTNSTNVVITGAGTAEITFNNPLVNRPSCTTNSVSDSVSCSVNNATSDNTKVGVHCFNTTNGTLVSAPFNIACSTQGSDFKLPTVQPILVNQIETGLKRGLIIDKCRITGTATVFGDCSHFINSATIFNSDRYRVNFKSGYWSKNPSCWVQRYVGAQGVTSTISGEAISLYTDTSMYEFIIANNSGTGYLVDSDVYCMGER